MLRLKELRLRDKKTQKELAAFLGVDRTTYTKYETGVSEPNLETLNRLSSYFGVSIEYLLGNPPTKPKKQKGVQVPVLGDVRAGYPMEAVENIIDYGEIDEETARRGEFYALRIKGDSMEPRFVEGDVVIVRKQETADSGDIVVALVNGDSATIKKLKRHQNGITLMPTNPTYEPMYYSNEEIMELPVTILGKVVELRAKF